MAGTLPPTRMPLWRAWVLAARIPTLPAAVVPVLVGTAVAWAAGAFRPLPFIAALVASLLIQIGTNYANDLFDFLQGSDTEARLGPTRVTQSGLLTTRQVATGTAIVFGLAVLVGIYLVFAGGMPILVIGILSILAGLAYTGGPYPLGYHGLGDLFCFIFFGPVAVIGTYYLHTGSVSNPAIVASVPVGLLVTAIIIVNNIRDIATDRLAGKRTLAVRLGRRATQIEYALCIGIAYLIPLGFWLFGGASWRVLLPLLTIPLAIQLVRDIWTKEGRALNIDLKQTARLHLFFGILFAIGLAL